MGADREPRAGVVVVLGEHGGALVDGVDDALGGPWRVELGVLELAGELLDQPLAKRGDVGGLLRGALRRRWTQRTIVPHALESVEEWLVTAHLEGTKLAPRDIGKRIRKADRWLHARKGHIHAACAAPCPETPFPGLWLKHVKTRSQGSIALRAER